MPIKMYQEGKSLLPVLKSNLFADQVDKASHYGFEDLAALVYRKKCIFFVIQLLILCQSKS